MNTQPAEPTPAKDLSGAVARRLWQVVMTYLILAAMLFGAAGRLNWGWAWAYLGAGLGILLLNAAIMSPELIAERGQPDKETIKDWDKKLTRLAILPTLGAPLVAGLDERWDWSPQLAPAVHVLGLILFLLGQGLFSWAMVSNKYFSTAVRIQQGHTVASGGPYRFVRHPGYTGYIATFVATALVLGSLWAFIPVGLTAVLFVARTALEDRTLQDELPGYRDYAQRVRHRLLPGVW